ncbi:GYD domain-containing protein [Micromonospora radicis]|uniref:GYD domain-containing protein n=1 Tax=Micromonospora radicis TaxID=1894971 RepID=A0A418MQQ7_9ACTN|nr:GYD domain-containing protein [Micromonospora radicis]RIV36017.1 GYD domain-containing protein [Micromonospora radicis]
MAKFLLSSTYTIEGLKGLDKDGGSVRSEIVRSLVENLGGQVDAFYFAFGEFDTYVICELPDHVTAAAIAITVRATGAVNLQVTPLLTPEQVDAATRTTMTYQPPGR